MEQNGLGDRNGAPPLGCSAQRSHPTEGGVGQETGRAPTSNGKRRAMLWGAGGTILSAVGFVALALFEQYNSMLGELRNDLKHFNETSGEYVKKENAQRYKDEMRDCLKEIQASSAQRSQLEQELRASEKAREQMGRDLQRMSERLAFVEGRQSASPPQNPIASDDK